MKIKDLVFDFTSNDVFQKIDSGEITFYLGIDPTADSLHIGHLTMLTFAKRLINKKNKGIIVMGGFTSLIGDPSGKTKERKLLDNLTIKKNITSLTKQILKFFDNKIEIINNYDWLNMATSTFLRDYGKFFNVATMVKTNIVKKRIEQGLSFTEFSYQVLQGIDFFHLAITKNCDLQIGGQDQWSNITSGINLINKKQVKKNAYGITLPLLTKANGEKFGKSASQTIWLNKTKTSPYHLYQFLFNTFDNEAISLIKSLTLVSNNDLKNFEWEIENNPKARKAQMFLASEVVKLVHGVNELKKVEKINKYLFSQNVVKLSLSDLKLCLSDFNKVKITHELDVQDLLVIVGGASSRREARHLIASNSIVINGQKIINNNLIFSQNNALYNKFHIIKKGKKAYFFASY